MQETLTTPENGQFRRPLASGPARSSGTVNIEFVDEFRMDPESSRQVRWLLSTCFPEAGLGDLTYFRQLPHYRLLAKSGPEVVGQLGIDYRVMNLDGEPVRVFGGIDLCVLPRHRGRGIALALLGNFESLARIHRDNVDFLMCASEAPKLYEKRGFTRVQPFISSLRIHQHRNYGVRNQPAGHSRLMVKPVGKRAWQDGPLDMLGYRF